MKLLERLASLRKTFVWCGRWGICFCGSSSFARFDDEAGGSVYGPYVLWFERVCWPVYRAVTDPVESRGVTVL